MTRPLARLLPRTTLVDTADIVPTPNVDTHIAKPLTLGDVSGILDDYERKTAEFSPNVDGYRLKLVGECALQLSAQTTDLSPITHSLNTAEITDKVTEAELDIPSSLYNNITFKNAVWHFDMWPKIRHTRFPTVAELTASHHEFSGFRQEGSTLNRGLIFEGDMTDWNWGGFEGAEAEYHTETETLLLSWKGKLYRSGDDVVKKHTQKATLRARKRRMKAARHD